MPHRARRTWAAADRQAPPRRARPSASKVAGYSGWPEAVKLAPRATTRRAVRGSSSKARKSPARCSAPAGRAGVALPVVRIAAPDGNDDYQHKYFTDDTGTVPGPADDEAEIQRIAVAAYRALGCRGWGATDLMIRAERPQTLPARDEHLGRDDRAFAGADVGARRRHQLRTCACAAGAARLRRRRRRLVTEPWPRAPHRCRPCAADVRATRAIRHGVRPVLALAQLAVGRCRLFAARHPGWRGSTHHSVCTAAPTCANAASARAFLHVDLEAARSLRVGALGAPVRWFAACFEPAAAFQLLEEHRPRRCGWPEGRVTRLVSTTARCSVANVGDVGTTTCRASWARPRAARPRCWRCEQAARCATGLGIEGTWSLQLRDRPGRAGASTTVAPRSLGAAAREVIERRSHRCARCRAPRPTLVGRRRCRWNRRSLRHAPR